MKKLVFVIIILSAFTFGIQAENFDYVITNNDTVFCKSLKKGINKIKCKMDNGEKITIKCEKVLSYTKNGKVYEKKPQIDCNRSTDKCVFMELFMTSKSLKK